MNQRAICHRNRLFLGECAYPAQLHAILNERAERDAIATITAWPGYAPTPLRSLSVIARDIGVHSVFYKDEASRFGLGSFKALGGAYALFRLIQSRVRAQLGIPESSSFASMRDPRVLGIARDITVVCATDGNHGRSVAWGASLFGCRCIIFVHEGVSRERRAAIEAYGAEVRRVPGNYDDSVHAARLAAAAHGWTVVSDTSYPGYEEIPKDVMQGYSVMMSEILDVHPQPGSISHVFVQAGVGGLAAAAVASFWQRWGARKPHFIIVEPEQAACLQESARNEQPTTVRGALATVMAGLACGEVSTLAWQILSRGAEFFMTIPDAAALDVMRLLAHGDTGADSIVAGESATAGLAAALIAAGDPSLRAELRLTPQSRILCLGTEGATDPEIYRDIVGKRPQQRLGR